MTSDLTTIPNVGPAIALKLQRLGFDSIAELRGQDGAELFERFCALEGSPQDPCLLDTFMAVADFADGGPARPWWEYSRERKERAHA
jgi:Pathogenicity locus